MIEIKHRISGEVLLFVEADSLRGADLSESNLRGSDLSESDLRGADLCGADLGGANLRGSNLVGAKLPADCDLASLIGVVLVELEVQGE